MSRRRWLRVSDWDGSVSCDVIIVWSSGWKGTYSSRGELLDEREQAQALGLGLVVTLSCVVLLLCLFTVSK